MRSSPSIRARDPWLDLLRAAAIVMVVVYHLTQMAPERPRALWSLAKYGHVGVDLFFALSGWLIGTIYWRELANGQSIALWRFWQRRWWRTIPGYLAALPLSWFAVFLARSEPFDWGYLLFFQNYYQKVPFFSVSWSLCVEEHFYLAMPLVLGIARKLRLPIDALFALLLLVPLTARYLLVERALGAEFGYYTTATHLRMEGLLIGFWVSRLPISRPALLPQLRWIARVSFPAVLAFAVWATSADARNTYVWQGLAVALTCCTLLISGLGGTLANGFLRVAIEAVAVSAYSTYLTHALMIHAGRAFASKVGGGSAMYFAIATGLVVLASWAFYFGVERYSLRLREHFAPANDSKRTFVHDATGTLASPSAPACENERMTRGV